MCPTFMISPSTTSWPSFVLHAWRNRSFTSACPTSTHLPPDIVVVLLADALDQDPPTILACWAVFRQVVWTHGAVLPTTQEIEAFNRHGLVRGIGALLFVTSLVART